MKQFAAYRKAARKINLPHLQKRGLIEAFGTGPTRLLNGSFRTFKSAVSLKRIVAAAAHALVLLLPHLQKRGLIEALWRKGEKLPTVTLPHLQKRGLIEAREWIRGGRGSHRAFRTFKSAVSLKHAPARVA